VSQVVSVANCGRTAAGRPRSAPIGDGSVERREPGQVETGTEGLERAPRGLQLALSAAPFALCAEGPGEQRSGAGTFVRCIGITP
jgi:hypothetical protein